MASLSVISYTDIGTGSDHTATSWKFSKDKEGKIIIDQSLNDTVNIKKWHSKLPKRQEDLLPGEVLGQAYYTDLKELYGHIQIIVGTTRSVWKTMGPVNQTLQRVPLTNSTSSSTDPNAIYEWTDSTSLEWTSEIIRDDDVILRPDVERWQQGLLEKEDKWHPEPDPDVDDLTQEEIEQIYGPSTPSVDNPDIEDIPSVEEPDTEEPKQEESNPEQPAPETPSIPAVPEESPTVPPTEPEEQPKDETTPPVEQPDQEVTPTEPTPVDPVPEQPEVVPPKEEEVVTPPKEEPKEEPVPETPKEEEKQPIVSPDGEIVEELVPRPEEPKEEIKTGDTANVDHDAYVYQSPFGAMGTKSTQELLTDENYLPYDAEWLENFIPELDKVRQTHIDNHTYDNNPTQLAMFEEDYKNIKEALRERCIQLKVIIEPDGLYQGLGTIQPYMSLAEMDAWKADIDKRKADMLADPTADQDKILEINDQYNTMVTRYDKYLPRATEEAYASLKEVDLMADVIEPLSVDYKAKLKDYEDAKQAGIDYYNKYKDQMFELWAKEGYNQLRTVEGEKRTIFKLAETKLKKARDANPTYDAAIAKLTKTDRDNYNIVLKDQLIQAKKDLQNYIDNLGDHAPTLDKYKARVPTVEAKIAKFNPQEGVVNA